MPGAAMPHAGERDFASRFAPAVAADTWLDQALADSFPAIDPLTSLRFD